MKDFYGNFSKNSSANSSRNYLIYSSKNPSKLFSKNSSKNRKNNQIKIFKKSPKSILLQKKRQCSQTNYSPKEKQFYPVNESSKKKKKEVNLRKEENGVELTVRMKLAPSMQISRTG